MTRSGRNGAVIQLHPQDVGDKKVSASFLYNGTRRLFERAGFSYDRPKGKYLLQICTDLPCALRGAEQFSQQACTSLGVQPGETTEDGLFTVENVMCLAACDKAPMMQVWPTP